MSAPRNFLRTYTDIKSEADTGKLHMFVKPIAPRVTPLKRIDGNFDRVLLFSFHVDMQIPTNKIINGITIT
tara:strand:- start:41 stop:253 length:213 start_codon:yes stop_codon:yes gene_type:complete